MSVIPGLPNEVAEQVLQVLTKREIDEFSKTSKANREVYKPDALYRDIRCYNTEDSQIKLGELIPLFAQKNSLARKVRRLELVLDASLEKRWNGKKLEVPELRTRLEKYKNVLGVELETVASAAEEGNVEAQAFLLLLLVEKNIQWFTLENVREFPNHAEFPVWDRGQRGNDWGPELEDDTEVSILPQLRRLRLHGWRSNFLTRIGSDSDSGQKDDPEIMETSFPWLRLADKDFHLMNDKLQVDVDIEGPPYDPRNFLPAMSTFRNIRCVRFLKRVPGTWTWISLEHIEEVLSNPETRLEELHICPDAGLDGVKERSLKWGTFESLKALTMTGDALFNQRTLGYKDVFLNLPPFLEVLRLTHEEWTVTSRDPLTPKGSHQTLSYLDALLEVMQDDADTLKNLKIVEIWVTLRGLKDWSDLQTSVPTFQKYRERMERSGLKLRWIVQDPSDYVAKPKVSSV